MAARHLCQVTQCSQYNEQKSITSIKTNSHVVGHITVLQMVEAQSVTVPFLMNCNNSS